jgi:predicted signal transduction protein with EAL and GGDEF domain
LRVTAEGVTSAAQFDFLHEHGCDEAQGYFLSGPLEASALRAWWLAHADRRLILANEIGGRIDVAQHAGIADVNARQR